MSTWQQQTTKREYWSLSNNINICEVKEPHECLKSEVCTGSCGSMGPTVFYTFLLESAHWSRKQYTEIWGYWSLKVPRLCGSHFSVGASILVQSGFLNLWEKFYGRSLNLWQKFGFVAEIYFNLCENNNINININITILWEYWNLSVVKLSFFTDPPFWDYRTKLYIMQWKSA